jgi:uncharacterized protein YxjI
MSLFTLENKTEIQIHQVRELAELFGFETRNKYRILDQNNALIGYAAEQGKGLWGLILRQFLGHWRSCSFHVFTPERALVLTAKQPFRFFFQRLELNTQQGEFLGAIQQRFSIFSKKFDVEDSQGQVVLSVSSPFFRFWTFKFMQGSQEVARIEKKWTGLLAEAFTDKDRFRVLYKDTQMSEIKRLLVLVSAIFVDLRYFEQKANR